jgi:hypothetical protein
MKIRITVTLPRPGLYYFPSDDQSNQKVRPWR